MVTLINVTLIILILPWVWSRVISYLRARAIGDGLSSEVMETLFLILMILPVFVGFGVLGMGMMMPIDHTPLPLPDLPWVHTLDGQVNSAGGVSVEASSPAIVQALMVAVSLLFWAHYFTGFLLAASSFISTMSKLRHITKQAVPLRKQGYTPHDIRVNTIAVLQSSMATMPFLAGRGKVVLPTALVDTHSIEQLDMVVRHEAAHYLRADTIRFFLLACVDVIFWLNRPVRTQTARCRLVAELACDRAVICAHPSSRKRYAQTLVNMVRHHSGGPDTPSIICVPSVFSPTNKGEYTMRLRGLFQDNIGRKKINPPARFAILALAGLLIPATTIQLSLAQSGSGTPVFSHAPLGGKITSKYGGRLDPINQKKKFHQGTDLKGNIGDAVYAPASGVVVRAEFVGAYGNLLAVDHGAGYVTRYAQLSAFEVNVGDRVKAGQVIARVGSSGRSTGPHLHFEVWKDKEHIDPQSIISLGVED